MRRASGIFVWMVMSSLLAASVQPAALAGVIGAEQYLSARERQSTLDRIDAVLAREEVRRELERLGVDASAAGERVAALSDRELQQLADGLEELPAGGLLGTIGAVFVVLLILELVGVIDIFNRI